MCSLFTHAYNLICTYNRVKCISQKKQRGLDEVLAPGRHSTIWTSYELTTAPRRGLLIIRGLYWRDGVGQWVARLTRNVEIVVSSPIKGPRCLFEQETLPLLLSTDWFQERIRAWFHNRTKINWGHYGRLT